MHCINSKYYFDPLLEDSTEITERIAPLQSDVNIFCKYNGFYSSISRFLFLFFLSTIKKHLMFVDI